MSLWIYTHVAHVEALHSNRVAFAVGCCLAGCAAGRMTSASSMRGLTQYITELRECKSRSDEEQRVNEEMKHILQRFRSAQKLDGYQRKKYVAKIVFSHLQGYRVDVGYPEIFELMSSTRYSEKQMVRSCGDGCEQI